MSKENMETFNFLFSAELTLVTSFWAEVLKIFIVITANEHIMAYRCP